MIVLLDLEWIDDGDKHLTQLSALRADDEWAPLERLNILVNPGAAFYTNDKHMAFGGLDIESFKHGVSTRECIKAFVQWLIPSDEIWVWTRSNGKYLATLLKSYNLTIDNKIYRVAKSVRKALLGKEPEHLSPYQLLAKLNETPPSPEHRSANDVETMRLLFKRTNILQLISSQKLAVTEVQYSKDRRAANADIIERTGYNYIFLKGSDVFHRRDCKLCLNAKSADSILGSVYYKTAAKNRRPCKLCKPQAPEAQTANTASDESYPSLAFSSQLPASNEASNDSASSLNGQAYNCGMVMVKLVTGKTVPIREDHIIGWCRYHLHRGALNSKLLMKHNCQRKRCPFLLLNPKSPFWNALAKKEAAKAQRKEAARKKKEYEAKEKAAIDELTEKLNAHLRESESDMYIVRISREKPWVYKLYYVSDKGFADGRCYQNFYNYLSELYPRIFFLFRHIRDVDGHFVSRDEYFSRCK